MPVCRVGATVTLCHWPQPSRTSKVRPPDPKNDCGSVRSASAIGSVSTETPARPPGVIPVRYPGIRARICAFAASVRSRTSPSGSAMPATSYSSSGWVAYRPSRASGTGAGVSSGSRRGAWPAGASCGALSAGASCGALLLGGSCGAWSAGTSWRAGASASFRAALGARARTVSSMSIGSAPVGPGCSRLSDTVSSVSEVPPSRCPLPARADRRCCRWAGPRSSATTRIAVRPAVRCGSPSRDPDSPGPGGVRVPLAAGDSRPRMVASVSSARVRSRAAVPGGAARRDSTCSATVRQSARSADPPIRASRMRTGLSCPASAATSKSPAWCWSRGVTRAGPSSARNAMSASRSPSRGGRGARGGSSTPSTPPTKRTGDRTRRGPPSAESIHRCPWLSRVGVRVTRCQPPEPSRTSKARPPDAKNDRRSVRSASSIADVSTGTPAAAGPTRRRT